MFNCLKRSSDHNVLDGKAHKIDQQHAPLFLQTTNCLFKYVGTKERTINGWNKNMEQIKVAH